MVMVDEEENSTGGHAGIEQDESLALERAEVLVEWGTALWNGCTQWKRC